MAEILNFYDYPRPFKNPHFASRLSVRCASAANKKNAKQILQLERERYSGGDGFLSAAQTAAKARGETLELPGKKKKAPGEFGVGKAKRTGRKTNLVLAAEAAEAAAVALAAEDDEDEDVDMEPKVEGERKEIFTYHTPTAPPSLLPAKKYCDITGLHAAYTDPRTKLRYKGLEIWTVLRNLEEIKRICL